MNNLLQQIKDFGPIIASISLFLAYFTLKANHDWNRRSYAAKMISEWNARIKPVTIEIEKIKPQIIDVQSTTKEPIKITQKEAEEIYYSEFVQGEANPNWILKSKFIDLLNELEHVASAYHYGVADKIMIEKSFRNTFVKWGYVLEHFITIYVKNRAYPEPWGLFHNVYNYWKSQPLVPPEMQTDDIFQKILRRRQ